MPNYRNVYEKDYEGITEKARRKAWGTTYDRRRQIDEDRINPCRGNVIKSNTYVMQAPKVIETNTEYEDRVNEVLESIDFGNQNAVAELTEQEITIQQFRERNNNQTKVEQMISDNER